MLRNDQTYFKSLAALKPCGINTARFLKYVWSFYNIINERFNILERLWFLKTFRDLCIFNHYEDGTVLLDNLRCILQVHFCKSVFVILLLF